MVRSFLYSSKNKQFLIFLFFLFLSGIFWLMETLNETYDEEFPVAVRLVGVPKNVVITTPLTDTVRVTVHDKGFMLLGYATSRRFRPVVLKFDTYADGETGHGIVPMVDIQRQIRQQLYSSSTISGIKSARLDFYFNYGRKKVVKVSLAGNIVPAKDYYLSHVQFWPDKVTVYASKAKLDSIETVMTEFLRIANFSDTVTRVVMLRPINGVKITPAKDYYLSHVQFWPDKVTIYASKAKLDSIETVMTEFLRIANFSDTVTRVVRLRPINGVKITPAKVKITLFPDILTEETMEVPITAINRPIGTVIRTFPQRVKVTFTVGASLYRQVKASDFHVVVDFKDIAAHPSDKCNLYVTQRPRGVSNVRLEMNQVDYLIEQQ